MLRWVTLLAIAAMLFSHVLAGADTAEGLFDQAVAAESSGNLEAAIEFYSKSAELDPQNAAVFNNRGIIYAKQRIFQQAIQDFNRAAALNPEDAGTFSNRGMAFQEMGKTDQALEDFNAALEVDGEHLGALYNRAALNVKLNSLAAAFADLRALLRLDDKHARARILLGKLYLADGATDKAQQELQLSFAATANPRTLGTEAGTHIF
jgi:tetratricopeptide (TPR) repeat protein